MAVVGRPAAIQEADHGARHNHGPQNVRIDRPSLAGTHVDRRYTRQPNFRVDAVLTAGSLFEALRLCGNANQAFVIGGGEIYSQALPLADRLYITAVDAEVEGDTFFPPWDAATVAND